MSSGDLLRPIIEAGTHMATTKDGSALFGALLDNSTNQVAGQAKFVKATMPSGNGKLALGLGLGLAGGVLGSIVYVNRHAIKNWWSDKAAPRLLAGAMWLADIDPKELLDASETTELIGPVTTEAFTTEVEVLVADERPKMSAEEAERRLLLVFMAAAIISEQLRALDGAKIQDSDLAALQAAMGKLRSADVVARLNEILAGDDGVLDADTKAVFVRVFGGGSVIDGEFRPLTLDGVQEALNLPDDEDDGPDAVGVPTR